ncbi:hypothetical protein L2E82_07593 [Cichorium intybus]|uniref:Uncharacterized protein n=1 Tax=Cichorium intybus TaxID=13427 RepID=A0ACB9G4K6_CICIN|nr:hypothetical protein L2E82_07593 [Cichorium intybus]
MGEFPLFSSSSTTLKDDVQLIAIDLNQKMIYTARWKHPKMQHRCHTDCGRQGTEDCEDERKNIQEVEGTLGK